MMFNCNLNAEKKTINPDTYRSSCKLIKMKESPGMESFGKIF